MSRLRVPPRNILLNLSSNYKLIKKVMEKILKDDLHYEHAQHFTYQEGCSTCWSENLKMDRSMRSRNREDLGTPITQGRLSDFIREMETNPLE